MYYEMLMTYAYRTSHKCVIKSISDKSVHAIQFSVVWCLLKIIFYTLVDMCIMSALVWLFGASLFVDYKGILKTGIIAGILIRESISISKLPEPSEDKNSF